MWSGLALSLACEGRHLRALVLLKEVAFGKLLLRNFWCFQFTIKRRWQSSALKTPQLVSSPLGSVMKNLICSQRALLGQSVPSIGRKVYLRISEHAVTCISGWAGTSSPMRLRLGNSVWVSVHLPEPTFSWLQTLTLETTLPSSTLACTWQPSAGVKRPILQLRELFYFSQIICQGDLES